MTNREKELIKKLTLQFKELQQIKSKEELGKAINNIIIYSVFKHYSDEFIGNLFKIKRDIYLGKNIK